MRRNPKACWSCVSPYLFFFFFSLFSIFPAVHAQNVQIDSLLRAFAHTSEDSTRITIMGHLVDENIHVDLEQALNYAQKALNLSCQTGDKKREAIALNNMGLVLYETIERPASLVYFEESEQLSEKLGMSILQTNALMSIASYHRYVDFDSTKTVQFFLKSIEVSMSVDYHWATARSYAKLASFYTRFNQISLSEKYLSLAAEYYLQLENGEQIIAQYYNDVGDKLWDTNPEKSMDLFFKGMEYHVTPMLMVSMARAYSYIDDNKKALGFLQEAIPSFENTEKRKRMMGIAIAQLAEIHVKTGNYKAAEEACEEGIELLTPLGRTDKAALPAFYRLKGMILEYQGDDVAALTYYKKSHTEAIKIKARFERIKSIIALGKFCSSKDLEMSKKYCEQSLYDSKKYSYTNLEIESCDCLYDVHKKSGSYKNALAYHEQSNLLIDSIGALKVEHALNINDKIQEKDKLLAEQAFLKKIKDEELKNQYALNTTLFFSTILGLILIAFLALGYRRINNQNKEINQKKHEIQLANQNLERSNKELERFAHIASHDLKSPLSNIINFTGLLKQSLHKEVDPTVTQSLKFIETSGYRMNQLIEDVLEYSQLGSDVTRKKEVINLGNLLDEISTITRNTTEGKSIKFEIADLPSIKWHSSKIFLLFKNLIENGIKYNQSDIPTIKIHGSYTSGNLAVFVEDNGIGIETEYYDKIFVMFNRLHAQHEYEGTGLGLATCKKIVDEFGGRINLCSEVNIGTTFRIEIPEELIDQVSRTEVDLNYNTRTKNNLNKSREGQG